MYEGVIHAAGILPSWRLVPGNMMTSSNGNIFRVTGHLCGEFTGHRWIPRTKVSGASFDVFFVRQQASPWTNVDPEMCRHMPLPDHNELNNVHYNDVIMGTLASQITSLTIVYSIVYSDADQRKHQSSASLAFVRGIHRRPVNSPHKWPVTFPFDDVIMFTDSYMPQPTHRVKYRRSSTPRDLVLK